MKITKNSTLLGLPCIVILALAGVMPAYAAETGKPLSREDLMGLARQFVNRVGTKFQQMETPPPAENVFDRYEDGEVLFFQISLPNRLNLERTITAVKQKSDVMILLSDFVTAADFAISVSPSDKRAQGWFLREDNTFLLDIPNRTVKAGDKTFQIAEGDIMPDADDIYISSQALATWFDFELKANLEAQRLNITPSRTWPIEEKLRRERNKRLKREFRKPPSLPLQDDPYEMVSMPNIELQTRSAYTRPGNGDSTFTNNYTSKIVGDVLGHTGQIRVTGNNEDKLSNLSASLYKESDQADLLGPLKARRYELGDITPVHTPLISSGSRGIGAQITNKDPYRTYDTTAQITGDATPGWDIELFRGDLYIATVTVPDDGRYVFSDVPLFAKENNFRIIQYGPQGEIREEIQTYNVDSSLYENSKGLYDVSLSIQNSQLYNQTTSTDEDKNTPHLAANYERQLTTNLAARTGVHIRQEDGDQKAYLQGGLVGTFDNTIINADTAIENEGAYAASLTARRRLKNQSLSARAQYFSQDFNPGTSSPRAAEYVLGGSLSGPIPFMGIRPTYNFDSEYRSSEDGTDSSSNSLGLSANIAGLTLGNTLRHTTNSRDIDEPSKTTDIFSVRGRAFSMLWRTTLNYEIQPDSRLEGYELELSKFIDRDLRGRLKFEHDTADENIKAYSKAELSVDWQGKHAVISPSIAYDTDQTVTALLNMKTGITKNPYTGQIKVAGETLSDKGGIAALVFLDKDGDNKYSENDELLEDVRVKALHASRNADTDAKGEAFLYNIPDNRVTDVYVDEQSFTDPYWVSGFPGVSIRPRAGHVSRIEFPIHMSGELDGTATVTSADGTKSIASNLHILLYDENGKILQTAITDVDGFYWMTKIPPGKYSLAVSADDARAKKIQPPPPQTLIFGYDGTNLYGNNINMTTSENPVAVSLISSLDKLKNSNPAFDEKILRGNRVVLNLGSYKSTMLMGLTWYKLKNFQAAALQDAVLLVDLSKSLPAPATGLHTLRVSLPQSDANAAYERCRILASKNHECTVELLPPPQEQILGMR